MKIYRTYIGGFWNYRFYQVKQYFIKSNNDLRLNVFRCLYYQKKKKLVIAYISKLEIYFKMALKIDLRIYSKIQ